MSFLVALVLSYWSYMRPSRREPTLAGWWNEAALLRPGWTVLEVQMLLVGVCIPLFLAVSFRRSTGNDDGRGEESAAQLVGLEFVTACTCFLSSAIAWCMLPAAVMQGTMVAVVLSVVVAALLASLAALSNPSLEARAIFDAAAQRRIDALESLKQWLEAADPSGEITRYARRRSSSRHWWEVAVWGVIVGLIVAACHMARAVVISDPGIGRLLGIGAVAACMEVVLMLYFTWRVVGHPVTRKTQSRWTAVLETLPFDVAVGFLGFASTITALAQDGVSALWMPVLLFGPAGLLVWLQRRSALFCVLRMGMVRRALASAKRQQRAKERRSENELVNFSR